MEGRIKDDQEVKADRCSLDPSCEQGGVYCAKTFLRIPPELLLPASAAHVKEKIESLNCYD